MGADPTPPGASGSGWWLPGTLVALAGVFFLALGVASDRRSPEFIDGLLFGGLGVVAGVVMISRRRPPADRTPDQSSPR